jgi:hypothetical protein
LDLRGNLLSELMPEVLMPLKKVRAVDLASNQVLQGCQMVYFQTKNPNLV